MPGTGVGTGGVSTNKTKVPSLNKAYILVVDVGRQTNAGSAQQKMSIMEGARAGECWE